MKFADFGEFLSGGGHVAHRLMKLPEAEVGVGFDKDGSFLKLADGLPLKQLTDTEHLKWAAIARGAELGIFHLGSTTITVFQPGKVELSPAQRALAQLLGDPPDSASTPPRAEG